MRNTALLTVTTGLLAATLACSATAASPNLVPNGNFESGDTQFSSDYVDSPSTNSDEGQYTVRSNPYPWNSAYISAGDHTTGTGLMEVANGSPTDGAVVWRSLSIAVAPHTEYYFEAYVMNVCCSGPFPGNTPSILEFDAAGSSLGTITTDLALAGTWQGLSEQWNSGDNTSVVLSLVNRNTARLGNDFAIDDIYLGTSSTVLPAVPEPQTAALLLAGLVALGAVGRRRQLAAMAGTMVGV